LYILGEELCAIDLASKAPEPVRPGAFDVGPREMRWSAPTALGPRQFQPLVEGSRAYVFGRKGLVGVDLRSGATETFSGSEKGGGAVLRLGDRVICVSNRGVTAYAIPRPEGGER
jgi:hypothetical protein